MAPIRSALFTRRRSSLSLLTTRRKSLVVPKSYTFAPNLTPISYPSDRTPPADENTPPSPSASPLSPAPSTSPTGDADSKPPAPENMDASAAPAPVDNADLPMPPPTRPRRRGPRRDSVEHIPRPPNAFMLFRQNFVHQRHVPGSIETNHNSLSRIVGNHWKALPASEKKRWEVLADKKKEEHKRLYPDYRFQPKHDPEKKRRRQEAKAAAEDAARREEQQRRAEEEQKRREAEGLPAPLAMPAPMSAAPMDEAQLSMQMRRNQERERRGQHFGHRRSSSVPLPMDAYTAYPYAFPPAFSAQAQANPFNFANPALAGPSQTSAPIALPTLPAMGGETGPLSGGGGLSNLNSMLPSWYSNSAPVATPTEQHSQSAGATPASGELQLPSHLQGTAFDGAAHARQAATLSRAGSPRLAQSLRSNTIPQQQQQPFAPQPGMGVLGTMAMYNQMHMNMNMGMGARAARQHQLGQLGRRASSTQPILQHQIHSGAFSQFANSNNTFNFGTASAVPLPPSSNVGFTNPFASGNDGVAGAAGVGSFPHPFAPNTMWFESTALSSPGGHVAAAAAEPEPLPEVDSYLLNPAFRFGATAVDTNPAADGSGSGNTNSSNSSRTSAEPSAPPSAVNPEFALGTSGPRGSFDFTAIMMNLPGAQTFSMMNAGEYGEQQQQQQQGNVDVSISPLENIPPHQQVPTPLAQPVPVRKLAMPEPSAVYADEYATQEYLQPFQQEYHMQEYQQHHTQQSQHQHQQQLHHSQHPQGLHQQQQHPQEYFQNSQPSSVASGSPDLSANSPHGFAEMHPPPPEAQSQSQSQETTPTDMHPGQIPHQQDTVAGTELLDGAYAHAGATQEVLIQQQHQQQQQATGVYPEPLSASLSGDALGLYYDQQQQQQQHSHHGEALQSYYTAAAGVCSGVDVLDNYGHGHGAYASQLDGQSQSQDGEHHHAHAYAETASAQGFEFSDFVHDSPYLGALGTAAN